MSPRVTLYTRHGCHLCEVAKETMISILGDFGIQLEELDVDCFPEKCALYGNDIPVVEIDDEFVYEHQVPPRGFRKKIEEAMNC